MDVDGNGQRRETSHAGWGRARKLRPLVAGAMAGVSVKWVWWDWHRTGEERSDRKLVHKVRLLGVQRA